MQFVLFGLEWFGFLPFHFTGFLLLCSFASLLVCIFPFSFASLHLSFFCVSASLLFLFFAFPSFCFSAFFCCSVFLPLSFLLLCFSAPRFLLLFFCFSVFACLVSFLFGFAACLFFCFSLLFGLPFSSLFFCFLPSTTTARTTKATRATKITTTQRRTPSSRFYSVTSKFSLWFFGFLCFGVKTMKPMICNFDVCCGSEEVQGYPLCRLLFFLCILE